MSYKVGDLELNIQAVSNSAINSLDEVIKKLTTVDNMLKVTTKNTVGSTIANNVKKSSKSSIEKSLNFGVIVTKLRMVTYFVKRIGDGLASVVQYGSDYTETLNKWQVAMRYNLNDADAFIKKMRTAYGISTQMLMDTQSTFKNLLSGLGGISEATSYQLSESVTQMMLDFASLYNQTIESASSKFQAMISGQIRPVRSVSGIDVSETSIYDLYTRLGGTKTMRQLNQMEKRLLRIYATFEQMQSAGATGDFSKTIEQWANQSRIMTENGQELVTWMGIGLKELLQSLGVLQYVNAALLTATEIVKALVYAGGYEDEDFVTNRIFESTENASEAVDELQGKLLDFDKFRTLEGGATGSPLTVDQTVLDALALYNSQLGKTKYKAQEIADTWLDALGISKDVWYENEKGIKISEKEYKNLSKEEQNAFSVIEEYNLSYKFDSIVSSLKSIAELIGVLIGYKIVTKIIAATKAITTATTGIKLFNGATSALLFGGIFLVIYSLNDLISNWDKMTTGMKIAKIALLGVGTALITFSVLSKIATANTTLLTKAFTLQRIAAVGLAVAGIGLLIANITLLATSWDKMSTWEKVVGIFGAIGAAALAAAAAVAAFQGSWTLGTAVVAIVGGLAAITAAFVGFKASMNDIGKIPKFAQGGMPDKGSLFIAGEAGAEMVVNNSNGQSAVMNMAQLQSAITNGMIKALSTVGDKDGNTIIKIGDEEVFTVVQKTAKRKGLTFARV